MPSLLQLNTPPRSPRYLNSEETWSSGVSPLLQTKGESPSHHRALFQADRLLSRLSASSPNVSVEQALQWVPSPKAADQILSSEDRVGALKSSGSSGMLRPSSYGLTTAESSPQSTSIGSPTIGSSPGVRSKEDTPFGDTSTGYVAHYTRWEEKTRQLSRTRVPSGAGDIKAFDHRRQSSPEDLSRAWAERARRDGHVRSAESPSALLRSAESPSARVRSAASPSARVRSAESPSSKVARLPSEEFHAPVAGTTATATMEGLRYQLLAMGTELRQRCRDLEQRLTRAEGGGIGGSRGVDHEDLETKFASQLRQEVQGLQTKISEQGLSLQREWREKFQEVNTAHASSERELRNLRASLEESQHSTASTASESRTRMDQLDRDIAKLRTAMATAPKNEMPSSASLAATEAKLMAKLDGVQQECQESLSTMRTSIQKLQTERATDATEAKMMAKLDGVRKECQQSLSTMHTSIQQLQTETAEQRSMSVELQNVFVQHRDSVTQHLEVHARTDIEHHVTQLVAEHMAAHSDVAAGSYSKPDEVADAKFMAKLDGVHRECQDSLSTLHNSIQQLQTETAEQRSMSLELQEVFVQHRDSVSQHLEVHKRTGIEEHVRHAVAEHMATRSDVAVSSHAQQDAAVPQPHSEASPAELAEIHRSVDERLDTALKRMQDELAAHIQHVGVTAPAATALGPHASSDDADRRVHEVRTDLEREVELLHAQIEECKAGVTCEVSTTRAHLQHELEGLRGQLAAQLPSDDRHQSSSTSAHLDVSQVVGIADSTEFREQFQHLCQETKARIDDSLQNELRSMDEHLAQRVHEVVQETFHTREVDVSQSLHGLQDMFAGELERARGEWREAHGELRHSLEGALAATQQEQRGGSVHHEETHSLTIHNQVESQGGHRLEALEEEVAEATRGLTQLASVQQRVALLEQMLPREDTVQVHREEANTTTASAWNLPAPSGGGGVGSQLENRVAALVGTITGNTEVSQWGVEDRMAALARKTKYAAEAATPDVEVRLASVDQRCSKQEAEQQKWREEMASKMALLETRLQDTTDTIADQQVALQHAAQREDGRQASEHHPGIEALEAQLDDRLQQAMRTVEERVSERVEEVQRRLEERSRPSSSRKEALERHLRGEETLAQSETGNQGPLPPMRSPGRVEDGFASVEMRAPQETIPLMSGSGDTSELGRILNIRRRLSEGLPPTISSAAAASADVHATGSGVTPTAAASPASKGKDNERRKKDQQPEQQPQQLVGCFCN